MIIQLISFLDFNISIYYFVKIVKVKKFDSASIYFDKLINVIVLE